MPLARAEYFEKILMNLSILRYIFKSNTKRGLYDLNKKSESFFCQLLNNVYDYNLQHLEQYQTNYPAIDLGDIAKKVAIQVTATNSSTKIKSTIKKFVEHNLHKKYDRLIILIITDKKSYTANFSSALEFDPKADIFDMDDILAKIEYLDLTKLEVIYKYVTSEVSKVLFANAGENSIFSKVEITPDSPPKSCNAFIEFINHEDKASIGKDIESILTLYKDLQSLSKTCREILVLILLKGGDGRYRSDTISINTRKLEDVANMATHELKAQVDQLIDLNIASVDDDGPTRIILQRTLKGSDLDFFYQIKNFCGTEERLKTTLVNLNFTTLD